MHSLFHSNLQFTKSLCLLQTEQKTVKSTSMEIMCKRLMQYTDYTQIMHWKLK